MDLLQQQVKFGVDFLVHYEYTKNIQCVIFYIQYEKILL